MSNTPAKRAYDARRSATTHRTSVRFSLELWQQFKSKCDRLSTTPHTAILNLVTLWLDFNGEPFETEGNKAIATPAVNSAWLNIKTQKLYKVLYAGIHTETGEALVIYQGIGDNEPADPDDVWCRPLSMWYQKFQKP